MPQFVRPGQVQVLSQDGEVKVTIALELTINLNTDGVKVSAQAIEQKQEKQPESNDWMIPDFGTSPKLNFGKRE